MLIASITGMSVTLSFLEQVVVNDINGVFPQLGRFASDTLLHHANIRFRCNGFTGIEHMSSCSKYPFEISLEPIFL